MKPIRFWIEVNEDCVPTGGVCFAHYPDDKPMEGRWLLVEEVHMDNLVIKHVPEEDIGPVA